MSEATSEVKAGGEVSESVGQDNKRMPSFADWAKNRATSGLYISSLPIGEYSVQFLGGELIADKWNPGKLTARYRFNHNGEEKILDSGAKGLTVLAGREGQHVTLMKTLDAKGKTSYRIK